MTKEELNQLAFDLGFSAVGVADPEAPVHLEFYRRWIGRGFAAHMDYLESHAPLKESPHNLLPSVRSVIVVALDYNQEPETDPDRPKIARYALGRDYHKVIRSKLKILARELAKHLPLVETRVCVDSAPILEREYANLAGLGWFGKNSCLIDSQRGSWFLIGVLLTSAEFERNKPSFGGCGSCTKCVDSCPTGAIVFDDGRWQVDSRRCISYLTIEHKGELSSAQEGQLDGWTFGCDVCQEVCPFNEVRESQPLRGRPATDRDLLARRSWPKLTDLLTLSSSEWNEITRGSAVRRVGHAGLIRNVRANLGEKGDSW